MANPRQRRKTKSSAHKTISHSKRAKRLQKKMPAICGPKVLQDAWDPSKTLRQNYQALGLRHDLNPIPSGGSEVTASFIRTDDSRFSVSGGPTVTPALRKGFGRIIRDSSGNILRVELPSDEEAGDASERDITIDTPAMTTDSELRKWANKGCPDTRREGVPEGTEDAIVQDLETLAASPTVHQRHTSFGERLYLGRLVKKHCDDLDKMARDRRLNPEQRTANELRRAIAKAGGVGELCEGTVTGVAE